MERIQNFQIDNYRMGSDTKTTRTTRAMVFHLVSMKQQYTTTFLNKMSQQF